MELLALLYPFLFRYPDGDFLTKHYRHGPILDLGSATGRVLEGPLKKGLSVTGIDSDIQMTEKARQRLEPSSSKSGGELELITGDFSKQNLSSLKNAPFETIVCAANTWSMLLEPEDRIRTLHQCHRALKEEGRLIIWIKNDNPSSNTSRKIAVKTPYGEATMELSWDENYRTKIRSYKMELQLGEKTETHVFQTALLSCEDAISEFKRAGFEVQSTYGSFDEKPYEPNADFQVYELTLRGG